VPPSNVACDDEGNVHALPLHYHTYGMTSDPLTQFACVFSALIHDVDHQGVPNAQHIAEKADIAAFYGGKDHRRPGSYLWMTTMPISGPPFTVAKAKRHTPASS
jgi:hypothetical protein